MPRYIDADALKAKYEQMLPEIGDGYHKETLQDVLFELEYAPTISLDEVRGVWLPVPDKIGDCLYKCSQCGFVRDAYVLDIGNYCPNCGAKMEASE